ncbi:invasion associated locus B family protein [uncultured Roseobacter sp.]|uniref:invasion associated locus B family protein n=1 Tax=uncultured Roseobacter sp. TaxID=114847 RepID=UPI00260CC606|nr:invasion associated locus B family protein [uncultured Roseobacter sp.]
MPKYTSILTHSFVVALPLVAASSFAFAQSDETEEQPAEAPGIENELSLGEVEPEGPKVGETYVTEKFDDWSLRCVKVESGDDPCQMYQLLADGEGAPISEFTLFRLPEGGQAKAGATVIVPLETSLGQQLAIKIDEKPTKRYPFAFCNNIGCYARIGLTEEDVESFKKGVEATLTIVPIVAPDQKVDIVLSLKGFTAGFEKVSVIQQ